MGGLPRPGMVVLGVTVKVTGDCGRSIYQESGWSWLGVRFIENDNNWIELAFRQRGGGKKVRWKCNGDLVDWTDL